MFWCIYNVIYTHTHVYILKKQKSPLWISLSRRSVISTSLYKTNLLVSYDVIRFITETLSIFSVGNEFCKMKINDPLTVWCNLYNLILWNEGGRSFDSNVFDFGCHRSHSSDGEIDVTRTHGVPDLLTCGRGGSYRRKSFDDPYRPTKYTRDGSPSSQIDPSVCNQFYS